MISSKFVLEHVLLDGKLQIHAKNSNFKNFESTPYIKSVSIPLNFCLSCLYNDYYALLITNDFNAMPEMQYSLPLTN